MIFSCFGTFAKLNRILLRQEEEKENQADMADGLLSNGTASRCVSRQTTRDEKPKKIEMKSM